MEKTYKKWALGTIAAFAIVTLAIIGLVVYVDPFFHYHSPRENIEYDLYDERYQNDGILRSFDYDTIITGSSLAENFRPSVCDKIFGGTAVKAPFAGGSYKEVNDTLTRAFSYNDNIKTVIRCLDYDKFFDSKDLVEYSLDSYPNYLYDDKLINDVKYVFNKEIIYVALKELLNVSSSGNMRSSLDEYKSQMNVYSFGKEAVNAFYSRDPNAEIKPMEQITEEAYATIKGNIEQNVIALAVEHPETEFYFFFSCENIYFKDLRYTIGWTEKYLMAEKYIIELLLPYENIHVYSFYTDYDQVYNLDAYHDIAHYDADTCDKLLQWLHDGKGLLTEDNYMDYWEEAYDYYMNLDYDSVYEELHQ